MAETDQNDVENPEKSSFLSSTISLRGPGYPKRRKTLRWRLNVAGILQFTAPMLLSLPNELLSSVLGVRDVRLYHTLPSVAITCRRLNNVVVPLLYADPDIRGLSATHQFAETTYKCIDRAAMVNKLHFHACDDLETTNTLAMRLPNILPNCLELHVISNYTAKGISVADGLDCGCEIDVPVAFSFANILILASQCPSLRAIYLCDLISVTYFDEPNGTSLWLHDLEVELPRTLDTLGLDCIRLKTPGRTNFWRLCSPWLRTLLIGTLDRRYELDDWTQWLRKA